MATQDPNVNMAQSKAQIADVQQRAEEVLQLINVYRCQQGRQALVIEPTLQLAAQTYANTLMALGGEGHEVGGTTVSKRVILACEERGDLYWYARMGENCAHGQGSPAEALQAWKTSPKGHNENMLREFWDIIGIGVAPRQNGVGYNWVTVFGQTLPAKEEAIKMPRAGLPTFQKGDDIYARLVIGSVAKKQIEPGKIIKYLAPHPEAIEDSWSDLGDNQANQPVLYYGIDLGRWGTTVQPAMYIVSAEDYKTRGIEPPMPPA